MYHIKLPVQLCHTNLFTAYWETMPPKENRRNMQKALDWHATKFDNLRFAQSLQHIESESLDALVKYIKRTGTGLVTVEMCDNDDLWPWTYMIIDCGVKGE